MNTIGIDLGYSSVKICALINGEKKERVFPSVVGNYDVPRFGVLPSNLFGITTEGQTYLIGDDAIENSREVSRHEDRNWIKSNTWKILFRAALSEVITSTEGTPIVVTGLPLAFYNDKDLVASVVIGEHRFTRNGRDLQTVTIEKNNCRIIPQPFGTLLDMAFNEEGKIANEDYLKPIAVIDIGGKTTNFLLARNLKEIPGSSSVNEGGWDVIRRFRDRALSIRELSEINMRDHEWAKAIINCGVDYHGKRIVIPVDDILEDKAENLVDSANQYFGKKSEITKVLITGGGALLLGEWVTERFNQNGNPEFAKVVTSPVLANARGYFKFAQKVASSQ